MYVRQHQCVAILRRSGWRCAMVGTWTREPVAWEGPDGERLVVPAQDSASIDFNEKGVWSGLRLGEVPSSAATAVGVADLGDDGLSPQGELRAETLRFEGHLVDGAWLLAGAHRIHIGTGAGAPPGAVPPDPHEPDRGLTLLRAWATGLG